MSDTKDLLAAIEAGAVQHVRRLIESGVDVNKGVRGEGKPLSTAVLLGNVEIVKLLFAAGADPAKIKPPLIFDSLILEHSKDEMVLTLIELGVDVHAIDPSSGSTALHYAAGAASPGILKRLIDLGLAVDARDKEGRTALHNASVWPCTDNMIVLLNAGADAKARSSDGARPLELFVESIPGAAMRKSMFGDGDDQSLEGVGIGGVVNMLTALANTASESEHGLPPGTEMVIDAFSRASADFAAPCRDGSGLLTMARAAGWPEGAIAKLASLGAIERDADESVDEDSDVDEEDDEDEELEPRAPSELKTSDVTALTRVLRQLDPKHTSELQRCTVGDYSLPVLVVEGSRAFEMWDSLRRLAVETGHWPIIAGPPWDFSKETLRGLDVETVEGFISDGRRIAPDPKAWSMEGSEEYGDEVDPDDEPNEMFDTTIPPDAKPRNALSTPMNFRTQAPFEQLALVFHPTTNSYEVPAYWAFGGFNSSPLPERHVAMLRAWHERYGAELACLKGDVLELVVERPPTSAPDAIALAEQQYHYCPDNVEQGSDTVGRLAGQLLRAKFWYFWWD